MGAQFFHQKMGENFFEVPGGVFATSPAAASCPLGKAMGSNSAADGHRASSASRPC